MVKAGMTHTSAALENFYHLLMHVPALVAILKGPDHVYELANPLYHEVIGRGKEIIGKPIRQVLPELEGQGIYELLDEVYATGTAYANNELKVSIDSERTGLLNDIYFEFVFQPIKDDAGNLVEGIFVHASDITEHVNIRKNLQRSEVQFRGFVFNSPVPTAVYIGREMEIFMANDAILTTWDKDASVIGKTFREALPELEGQPFYKLLDDVFTTGITYQAAEDRVMLFRNGKLQETYFNFVYKALKTETGEIYGVMNTGIEVTELVQAKNTIKQAEERLEEQVRLRTDELQQANAKLVNINEQLQQFAYVASHDLQEPLRKIHLFSDRLLTEQNIDKAVSEGYLHKIVSSAIRMTNLIKDLLNFSQLSSRDSAFSLVNLDEVVENLREDFELQIAAKGATLKIDPLGTIEGSALQMNQLFFNLVSNALKFSRDEVPPVISISARMISKEECLANAELNPNLSYKEIIVSDNGIGFEQQFAKQIFIIFQRLHGNNSYEGTGIGLALCKKIVDFHQGDIFAESSQGRGAAFHIWLPTSQK